jgi:hypothetical protein
MNGIKVPEQYKGMLRKARGDYGSREFQEATLRDYIQANPDKVLTLAHFQEALGGNTSTGPLIRRLMKSGHVIRTQQKNGQRGHAYTYRWVNKRTIPDAPKADVPPAIHITPRSVYATQHELRRLDEWFIDFLNEDTENLQGANEFRKLVNNKGKKGEV